MKTDVLNVEVDLNRVDTHGRLIIAQRRLGANPLPDGTRITVCEPDDGLISAPGVIETTWNERAHVRVDWSAANWTDES